MTAADCVHFLVIGMYHIKSSHYTVCSRFLSLSIIKNSINLEAIFTNYAEHFLEILTPPSFCEHFYSVLFMKILEMSHLPDPDQHNLPQKIFLPTYGPIIGRLYCVIPDTPKCDVLGALYRDLSLIKKELD